MLGDVCVLFEGTHAHAAHRQLLDPLDAEYRHFETGRPPTGENQNGGRPLSRLRTSTRLDGYDTVVAEGTAPLQTLLAARPREQTAVFLLADETFAFLPERRTHHVWRALAPLARRLLDGVVPVSRLAASWGEPYVGGIPTEVVHPPLDPEKYDRLGALPVASPDPFTVLSVGAARPANNHDRLVRATADVDGEAVGTVLFGSGHPDRPYADREHVNAPGFVDTDTFVAAYRKASCYVQPSTADAFGLAPAEGVRSGTPTLVSTGVGARERLSTPVVEPTVTALRAELGRLREASRTDREATAERCRPDVADLTVDRQAAAFAATLRRFAEG
jgi:glycosyltransferase involved in cell wall biosynthesis